MIPALIILSGFVAASSLGYGLFSGSTNKVWLYTFYISWTSLFVLPFFTK